MLKNTSRILIIGCLFDSFRMFVGAVSAVYLLTVGGITIQDLAYIKSFQSVLILFLSLYIGKAADKYDRKNMVLLAFFSCILWLLMMYLGGIKHSLIYFYVSELFNAISISITLNTYNAYLIDSYYKETKSKQFERILGHYAQYSFLGIALSSFIGALLYQYWSSIVPIIPLLLVSLLFMAASFILPKQAAQTNKQCNKKNSTSDFLFYKIIIRKILSNLNICLSLLLISSYYQVIIQYWQVIANELTIIKNHSVILGLLFFMMMLAQALSGALSKRSLIKLPQLILLLVTSNTLLIASIPYQSPILLTASLALFYFSVRSCIILSNSILHAHVYGKIRARFDSVINTSTRLLAATLLLASGLLAHAYGTHSIIYLGLTVNVLALLALFMKREKVSLF